MYDYNIEKHKMFTEEGQRRFLKIRDKVYKLLKDAGAFKMSSATKGFTGSSWEMMSYVDRLVELGEIKEITSLNVFGQDRVFVSTIR